MRVGVQHALRARDDSCRVGPATRVAAHVQARGSGRETGEEWSNERVRRVLIYRLGSLGDMAVAVPALRLVARAFPHAERRMLTNVPVHAKAPAAAAVLDGRVGGRVLPVCGGYAQPVGAGQAGRAAAAVAAGGGGVSGGGAWAWRRRSGMCGSSGCAVSSG